MSKKLLSEAQIRRFQSLANLPVVSEMAYAKKDDTDKRSEEEKALDQQAAEERSGGGQHYGEGMHKEDMHKEDMHKEEMHEEMHEDEDEKEMGPEPMEPEMDMDAPSGDLDLSEEEARAIIDLGKKLEGIMDADAKDEPEMDDMEADAAEMGAEDEMDMPGDMLEGVSVEPSRKEVVEEVARRVARRLNEAKRAQRRLNRALGNK